ncbi:MAG: LPS-assembly protein LptD [Rhizobiaceae bacterium]
MTHPKSVNLMHNIRSFHWAFVAFTAAGMVACGPNLLAPNLDGANAQEITQTLSSRPKTTPGAQMLLESDDLIYDNDQQLIIASGNVQIAYDGYTLVAEKVTYNRTSGRVTAQGSVEILEPSGNRVFADEIDLTDDFSNGFIAALRVETADETRIAATSAERIDGAFTVFHNGVYTACKACKENPSKPPLWQIRARKISINNDTKAVEYEDASFEVFGVPIIRLPRFSHADPAIKRKSGFLFPDFSNHEALGVGVRSAYFFNLAPNFDLTLTGGYYSRQGLLAEAEWRHRLENGSYSIKVAGIDQQNPDAFDPSITDSEKERRAAVATVGKFDINSRWKFGWNALLQSDKNFARTYSIDGFESNNITNEIYLQGLSGKNYFNFAIQDFLIQNSSNVDVDLAASGRQLQQDLQANVLPILDYNLVSDGEDGVGQVSFDFNMANLTRSASDIVNKGLGASERFHGIRGEYTRASLNLEWKGSTILDGGALITSSLGLRGDGIQVNSDGLNSTENPLMTNESIYRVMPSAMLEIRFPMIASNDMGTHIFEPIAQIITRTDETHIGLFPNEDAQSLVFDAASLFDTDKFSGYDRVEGGTRANIGFRYSTNFEQGGSLDVVAGQSFHLAGTNSFAQNDLTNAGDESGLETARSDYVASIALNSGKGVILGLSGRFDEKTFKLRRTELGAQYTSSLLSMNTSYIFTDAQPNYASIADRHEINASGSLKLNDNWRAFGNVSYDIQNNSMISDGIGLAYDDECYSFSVSYNNSRSRTGDTTGTTIGFKFGLRTIGGYGYTHQLNKDTL